MEKEEVSFDENHVLLDLQNYPSGVYHLILMNEYEIFREQVSIVH